MQYFFGNLLTISPSGCSIKTSPNGEIQKGVRAMAINTQELRGVIYAKYGTAAAMTERLNWDKNKIGKILKGRYIPDIDECAEMAEALDLEQAQFCHIFLPDISPNGDLF